MHYMQSPEAEIDINLLKSDQAMTLFLAALAH